MGIIGINVVSINDAAVLGVTITGMTGAYVVRTKLVSPGITVIPVKTTGAKVVVLSETVFGVTTTGTTGANAANVILVVLGVTTVGTMGAKLVIVSVAVLGTTVTGNKIIGANVVSVSDAVVGVTVVPLPLLASNSSSSNQPSAVAVSSNQPAGRIVSSNDPMRAMGYSVLIHCSNEPALAVMAELATSEAKRAMTVPVAEGLITPSINAMLPAVREEAFDAAGMS